MGVTLPGRTALVTGASSGIGAATAARLASAGCHLLLVGRDRDRLADVADRTGGRPVPVDLATDAGIARLAEHAEDVDILVNNAGIGWAGPLSRMEPDTVRTLVTVNLTSAIQLTRALWPAMARRGGHVAFVSSIATIGVRDEAVYAATKAALRAFAASLRQESAGRIGVTTAFPGPVDTRYFARRGRPYDRAFPRKIPPETVASALVNAIRRGKPEVFVPRWLAFAARLQGAAPATFHHLANRFG